MQTFSKIIERLVARRLAKLAWEGAYKKAQMGSVAGRSCSDAAMALYQRVSKYQFAGKKVSLISLDVKGGFDHVRHDELIKMLKKKRCPDYLTTWINNIIAYRLCTLIFPGSPKKTHRVNTGIPQGSPLSPLLFIMYVACLHLEIPTEKGFMLSYVDDFKFTIARESYQDNVKIMKREYKQVTNIAEEIGVSFSIEKIELIHWKTPKQREGDTGEGLELEGVKIHPAKDKLR